MKLFKPLKRIVFWGVSSDLQPVFAKRIILTNLLGLLFTLNMSFSAIAFLCFGYYGLALFTLFFVITEFSWPVFNYYKRYSIARIGLLTSSNFLGFAVSVMLPGSFYNRGFYVMAGIPILLFTLKEKKSIILGLLLPLVLYPLSEYAQYQIPFALILTPEIKTFLSFSVGTIYIVLIFLMFLFLAYENARAEEQLEVQRLRSFTSAKFAALGEMAAGISHEINNPMTVINLTTEHVKMVLQTEADNREEAMKRLGIISNNVDRVVNIIESMRTFSREASGDPFKEVSLKKVVNDTITFCTERFKNNEVQFEVVMPDTAVLNCRAAQISQVLLNLLNNAYDAVSASSEKWIKLEIIDSDKEVLVSVTDSGSGVPAEVKDKIFDPFYTTKPVGKGTGLGLSLSRKIIIDHGGTLTLDPDSLRTKFVARFKKGSAS